MELISSFAIAKKNQLPEILLLVMVGCFFEETACKAALAMDLKKTSGFVSQLRLERSSYHQDLWCYKATAQKQSKCSLLLIISFEISCYVVLIFIWNLEYAK